MKQTTHNIVMVRPANFFSNPETSESNRFQKPGQDDAAAQDSARAEFDGYVAALRAAGVNVLVIDDEQQGNTPDSIFPNNWISMHPDGRVFLYPMEAPNRRRERRDSVIERIRAQFAIGEVCDLSAFEAEGKFLEGTGSMVFDHDYRLAYVCRSSRSHPEVLAAGDTRLVVDHRYPRSGVHAVRAGPPLAMNLRRAATGQALQAYWPPQVTLNLLSCGTGHAVAGYGPLAAAGAWVWRWKDRIDRAFVARHHRPQQPS